FAGELHVAWTGGFQLVGVRVNRVIQARGSGEPGSYAFVPVTPASEGAVWRGRRLRAGSLGGVSPDPEDDPLTARGGSLGCLTLRGDLLRRAAAVLRGHDLEKRLAGKVALAATPAFCLSLRDHLLSQLARVEAAPALLGWPGARTALEEGCVRWLVRAV